MDYRFDTTERVSCERVNHECLVATDGVVVPPVLSGTRISLERDGK